MTTFVPLSNEELLIFLCSSDEAPIECKDIMANLTRGRADLLLTSSPKAGTSSTSLPPSSLSGSSGVLHEILPYVAGILIFLMVYLITVCLLRFAAKLSWVNSISLALGLLRGKEAVCCIFHQTLYAANSDAASVIPAITRPADPSDVFRRGAVQLTNLNVQESSV
jgi:hypothetical protein